MEAVERKNPDLKIGYVPVPAEIPVPAEALAREEMPARCGADPDSERGTWGELALGPLLLVIGLFMLVGDRLNLPQFGFSGNAEGLAKRGGWGALLIGGLFALAFCPTSGVFYFGMLIPLSASVTAGYLLLAVFAVATAIPVLAVAWILAFSVQQIGSFYGKMQKVQKWMNLLVGVVFILVGIYYCWIMYV